MPKLKQDRQDDFSGGINAVASPYKLKKTQVQRSNNLILDEHGSLRTRDGFTIITTGPTSDPIVYRGVLNKENGTSFPYAVTAPSGGQLQLFRTNTTPWTLIGSLNSTEGLTALPQTTTLLDTELIAVGYTIPNTWDGTTLGVISSAVGQTTPPGARHLIYHLGALWLWNTFGSTSSLDGPSSLRQSDINNFNSWPNSQQTFVGKADGQFGTGMATFTIAEAGIAPTQTLILFKNQSMYEVTGVFGASTFAIQKTKTDMGCIAPRTVQFCTGLGVIRLGHKGFALFNGVDDQIISEEVRPYIFGKDEILPLNFNAVNLSWAVQASNPPLYIAICPVAGNSLTRVFVYDLVRRAWSIGTYPVPIQCLSLFSVPGQTPVIHAGASNTGQIIDLFNGAQQDNGVDISWSLRTRPFTNGSSMDMSFWRRFLMDMTIVQNTTVSVTATYLGLPSLQTGTMLFKPVTGALSRWSTGIWGTMIWNSAVVSDVRSDFSLMRTAPGVTLDISGSGPVRIRGIEVQSVPKPPTKAIF